MLGTEPGEAGSRSKYGNHYAMMPPPLGSLVKEFCWVVQLTSKLKDKAMQLRKRLFQTFALISMILSQIARLGLFFWLHFFPTTLYRPGTFEERSTVSTELPRYGEEDFIKAELRYGTHTRQDANGSTLIWNPKTSLCLNQPRAGLHNQGTPSGRGTSRAEIVKKFHSETEMNLERRPFGNSGLCWRGFKSWLCLKVRKKKASNFASIPQRLRSSWTKSFEILA